MDIYIPNIDFRDIDKRHLFIATRPFYMGSTWGNDQKQKKKWGISDNYTDDINIAQVMLLPKPINYYNNKELEGFNLMCKTHGIKGYGYVIGDYGNVYKHFEYLSYFRVGGFKRQLPHNNIGLPVAISDIYKSLYKANELDIKTKADIPIIGFCGHASDAIKKQFKDKLGFIKKNMLRFFENPFRQDYEPLFASAYERFKLLKALEGSASIKTNFIYRENYRAGAVTKQLRLQTNREYYENMRQSDYVLCVRGAGNFSVRLYETLMMGRIPVYLDTDGLLPFVDDIDWKQHMVWVPWHDRHNITQHVVEFHQSLTPKAFKQLQESNRKLWETSLSVVGIFDFIRKNSITT